MACLTGSSTIPNTHLKLLKSVVWLDVLRLARVAAPFDQSGYCIITSCGYLMSQEHLRLSLSGHIIKAVILYAASVTVTCSPGTTANEIIAVSVTGRCDLFNRTGGLHWTHDIRVVTCQKSKELLYILTRAADSLFIAIKTTNFCRLIVSRSNTPCRAYVVRGGWEQIWNTGKRSDGCDWRGAVSICRSA